MSPNLWSALSVAAWVVVIVAVLVWAWCDGLARGMVGSVEQKTKLIEYLRWAVSAIEDNVDLDEESEESPELAKLNEIRKFLRKLK